MKIKKGDKLPDAKVFILEKDPKEVSLKEIVGDGFSRCPVQSPVCTKYIEGVHEILPRGRAGGIIKAHREDNLVGTCHACNGYISEHAVWATELGWLKHYDYNEQTQST